MLSPPAVQTQPPSIASTHIVHDFVTFFGRKVEDIETTTSAATSPDIQLRPTSSSEMDMGWVHPCVGLGRVGSGEEKWTHFHLCNSFCHIYPVSCSEVTKMILASMPSKSCSLDSVSTWMVKNAKTISGVVIRYRP